jgi:hypothetical protein
MHNNFATIDAVSLEDVTGGTDWGKVWDSTKTGASDYGMGGALLGAAVGTAAPGIGTLTGAGAGGLIGTAVGGAYGAGKELYNQWGSGQ